MQPTYIQPTYQSLDIRVEPKTNAPLEYEITWGQILKQMLPYVVVPSILLTTTYLFLLQTTIGAILEGSGYYFLGKGMSLGYKGYLQRNSLFNNGHIIPDSNEEVNQQHDRFGWEALAAGVAAFLITLAITYETQNSIFFTVGARFLSFCSGVNSYIGPSKDIEPQVRSRLMI